MTCRYRGSYMLMLSGCLYRPWGIVSGLLLFLPFFPITSHASNKPAQPDLLCGSRMESEGRIVTMFSDFVGLTNAQVYEEAFRNRLMAPHPTNSGEFLGNDQRALFLPFLRRIVKELGSGTVLDVGAGSGEILDLVLSELRAAELYIEEPNADLLAHYQNAVLRYPHVHLRGVYPGNAQDFFGEKGRRWFQQAPLMDLILAIHMIYHVELEELETLFVTLYEKLAPGGVLFTVFADQERSTSGNAARHFFQNHDPKVAERIKNVWNARSRLFKHGEIKKVIERRIPGATVEIQSRETPSRFYARTLQDLAVMCFTGELGINDSQPVQIERLTSSFRFLESSPQEVDLRTETQGYRDGWVSSAQPQIICEIRKPR